MILRQPTGLRIIPEELRNRPAIELLRMGYDTSDIATCTGRNESEIYNEISRGRGLAVVAGPTRGFIDNRPIGQIKVGEYFSIPVKNRKEHGAYVFHLKKKLGIRGHFQIAPDDENGNIRIIRVK